MTNTEAITESLMTLPWCWLERDLCEHNCELGRVGSLESAVLAAIGSHSLKSNSYGGNWNVETNMAVAHASLCVLYDRCGPNCWSCFIEVSLSVPPSSTPQYTDPLVPSSHEDCICIKPSIEQVARDLSPRTLDP